MRTPVKPFPSYKWRWATVTPTLGLNSPPVFLGVLRALRAYEGRPTNNPSFIAELRKVKLGTSKGVNVVRTPVRNIIRNSGQYWKALGVLKSTDNGIKLTRFGRSVADRKSTRMEFATTVVKTLQLPNARIESDIEEWRAAGLEISPLELILSILANLYREAGGNEAYLTPFELIRIVIPLAGEAATVKRQTEAILLHRKKSLNISGWPDCAPDTHDPQMAREFLIFLGNYGLCQVEEGKTRMEDRYYLGALSPTEAERLASLPAKKRAMDALKEVDESGISSYAERRKAMIEVLVRPQQALFRKNVLAAYGSTCALTGEKLPEVLEAAHIKPVSQGGEDKIANGFCFRADIHTLFDSSHLQIDPRGEIQLSSSASRSRSYRGLRGSTIRIKKFVDWQNIEWRWKYY